MATVVQQIPVREIVPDPKQPRKTFNPETLRELGETIKKRGQRQPINVEKIADGYQIIEGERRWRACILVGLRNIDAIVRERSNHNGRENLLSQIIENVQREDMNPVDEAKAYRQLKDVHHMSVYAIAAEIHKNASRVYRLLKILDLPAEVQQLMQEGKLSTDNRVIDALLSIANKKAQIGLAERASNRNMKIDGIVAAARHLTSVIGTTPMKISQDRSPALVIARRTPITSQTDEEQQPARWNGLKQAGQVPAWPLVVLSAKHTCQNCELRDMANESTCGNCPLVNVLHEMLQGMPS